MLAKLPERIVRDIELLAEETGESMEKIIETGLRLFREQIKSKAPKRLIKDIDLPAIRANRRHRATLKNIMSAIAKHSLVSMTKEAREDRARKGAEGVNKKLSPEARKERAKKAAKARWKKKPNEPITSTD